MSHRLLLPFDLLGTQLGTFLPPLLFIPIALYPFQQGPFLLDFFFFAGTYLFCGWFPVPALFFLGGLTSPFFQR